MRRTTTSARQLEDFLLEQIQPLVPVFGALFGPHCEIVLHDFRTPERSILAIANGHVTGRVAGGPVLGVPLGDTAVQVLQADDGATRVLSNYYTYTPDGRKLLSNTVFFRTEENAPFAALCVNCDVGEFERVKKLLAEYLPGAVTAPLGESEAAAAQEPRIDVNDLVAQIIADCIQASGIPTGRMTRSDRLACVSCMMNRGLFLMRGAVKQAAKQLGISKFTLYSYLEEVRPQPSGVPRPG